MARNFQGTKFLRISSKKYFEKNFLGWTNYIKPTITIHKFIIHMKINDSDIRASLEVESMVHGYHCYSTMRIGEEPPCKLDYSSREYRFVVAVCQKEPWWRPVAILTYKSIII